MAQMTGIRPFYERDLTDQLRLYPAAFLHIFRSERLPPPRCLLFRQVIKRALGRYELLEYGENLVPFQGHEAVLNLCNKEKSLAFVDADEQCVEAVRTRDVTSDQKFLLAIGAVLNPMPSFQLLQNNRPAGLTAYFYVFDLLIRDKETLLIQTIEWRRERLSRLLPASSDPIRLSPLLDAPAGQVLEAVRKLGLEGVIGKRSGSVYEAGERSGAFPCPSRATISPSRTKSPSNNLSASTTFGKRSLRTFLLREKRVTSEPRFTAIHR
jgi:hypothetical protein